MTKRLWPERATYAKFRHSFDVFYRKWVSSYYKFPDYWVYSVWYDAQCIYKWKYIAIEYKACINKEKHTFSSYPDLEAELKRLRYIESIWWHGFVIIVFTEHKWMCKAYDTNFVVENWNKQIDITFWWIELPKWKSIWLKAIWDMQFLFNIISI